MDRFTKTCLVLTVLLLAVISLRPVLTIQPVHAAQNYEYADFETTGMSFGKDAGHVGDSGWEIISVLAHNSPLTGYIVFVRRASNGQSKSTNK
jgi:hypothetical protein